MRKRSRYYQGQIDTYNLDPGEDYNLLKKTYVIFICTFNLLREARAEAITEGRAEGKAEALDRYVKRSIKNGVDRGIIISDIMEDYDLSREAAEEKVRKCCV